MADDTIRRLNLTKRTICWGLEVRPSYLISLASLPVALVYLPLRLRQNLSNALAMLMTAYSTISPHITYKEVQYISRSLCFPKHSLESCIVFRSINKSAPLTSSSRHLTPSFIYKSLFTVQDGSFFIYSSFHMPH